MLPIFFEQRIGSILTTSGFQAGCHPPQRRRSTFGVGLDGQKWVNYLEQYSLEVEQLMKLTPSQCRFYQQGMRAATLIQSIS